jgi:MFS family permease
MKTSKLSGSNIKNNGVFNLAVIVAALGYFVDIYDLLLFTIVRGPSLAGVGIDITNDKETLAASTRVINWQMAGLIIGGILWGVMGDKKGRIGGILGIGLLLLRISVSESGMFKEVKDKNVSRGNLFMFFNNRTRFRKYMLAILIGLPTWYVIGILVNLSNLFAGKLYGQNAIISGKAIMYAYLGIAIGDILIGFISQYFKSRKKALYLFYALTAVFVVLFFSPWNNNDSRMYLVCGLLGFSTGFWAIFVTMGAEQFGTNLRATAATTIPNMVRGALVLINLMFKDLFQDTWGWGLINAAIVAGIIVMAITLISAYFTQETFHKDLSYIEGAEPVATAKS